MATSGVTTLTFDVDDIITEALENLAVLDIGDSAEANDVTSATRTLNMMLKSMQADPNIQLRFRSTSTISAADGTSSYNVDSDVVRVLDAWITISGTVYPLTEWNQERYDNQTNPTTENLPYAYYVDYAPDISKMYLFPTPDASYTVTYRFEREVEDVTATTETLDLPVEAVDMVVMALTARLAPKFQVPMEERAYWDMKARQAKLAYLGGDLQNKAGKPAEPSMIV